MIDVSQPPRSPRLNEVGWGKRGRGVVNVVVCLFFTGPILHNAEIRISIFRILTFQSENQPKLDGPKIKTNYTFSKNAKKCEFRFCCYRLKYQPNLS